MINYTSVHGVRGETESVAFLRSWSGSSTSAPPRRGRRAAAGARGHDDVWTTRTANMQHEKNKAWPIGTLDAAMA